MSAYNSDKLERVDPDYLASYGLREAPFSAIHDDRFLYLDVEHAQRLSMLQHMARSSNLLLMVEGERGSGKTALLTRFVMSAESDWCICQVNANAMMDAEQLMFQAAQGFDIGQLPQDASQLQELLYKRVAALHHEKRIPILIIDNAHELPRDALLAIFNLADTYVDEDHLLRIILFCEPQIEKVLSSKDVRALRDRITHTLEIPLLDEEATAEYLKHRMAVAGFTGSSPFSPRMIKRIQRTSMGIPEKINELAHEILQSGDFNREEKEPVSVAYQLPRYRQTALISLVIIVIAMVLVFQNEISSLFREDNTVSDMELVQETKPAEQNEITSDYEMKQEVANSEGLRKKIIPLDPVAMAEKAQQVEDKDSTQTESMQHSDSREVIPSTNQVTADAEESLAMEKVSVETAKPIFQIDAVNPGELTTSNEQQTLTITGKGFTPQSEVIVSWTGNEKKLSSDQVSVESESRISIRINTGKKADNWQVRVLNPEQNRESNPLQFQVVSVKEQVPADNGEVLAKNPEAFTLQLFGSNQQKNAEQFISQHQISDRAVFFQTTKDGQVWYSVVYGEYPDQTSARNAIDRLPAGLRKLKPWVRRFDDIQASINATGKTVTVKKQVPVKIPLAVTTLPVNASAEQNASWLWSQNPGSYTLQLLGSRQSDSVKKFLRKYTSLNGKAVYFHTRHDAQDWYAVVYGVYPSRVAAKSAIERLPAELKSSSPWIRSFASIHAELDRAESR